MANLNGTPSWDDVFQLELDTVAKAGVGGVMNTQAQALLNRIEYLTSANGSTKVGTSSGKTVQQLFDILFGVYDIAPAATGDSVVDTNTILSAFTSERKTIIPAGTYNCNPLVITGKIVDVEFMVGTRLVFTHQGADSIYFNSCTGNIKGQFIVEDSAETIPGVFCTFLARNCIDFHVNSYTVFGGKDLPFAMVDCDNSSVSSGIGIGSDLNRPFAWQLIGCKDTKIIDSRLYKYQFGFTLIGPGYKSGTRSDLMTTRPYASTIGMGVVRSYVEDHTGHAFDMNGTVGAFFEQCTGTDYTGSVGNSTFQVKQSTNIPAESADDAFVNRITDCFAINCVGGFSSQEGTDVQMRGLHIINCKRYPVAINSTKRFIVDGVTVRDWGLDLAAWPLQNGDTECAIVTVWSSSNNGTVQGVRGSLTNTSNPNISTLSLANIVGSNVTIDDFNINRETGVTTNLYTAIRISGANCQIGQRFRCGGAIYSQNPIIDTTTTTIYPLEFGINVDLSVGGITNIIDTMPQRGMVIGKVFSFPTTAPTGSPTYSVGTFSRAGAIIASRAVPSTVEFLDPLTTVNANIPLGVRVTTVGTGRLQVSVRGINLL